MFTSLRRRGACSRPQYGAAANLPALSICRLEAPEETLKKLRQHAEDPAMAEFTCPICWEPFWQPVRTVCGHAFCEGCLLKSVLAQLGYDQPDVSCPMCRHPLHVEDVAADEALLTRIRLVVAQKSRESEAHSRTHAGRLHRGSTCSPAERAERANPRALRCTGQPCTPVPVEWPVRAFSSGAQRMPFQGSFLQAASDARPATSGCVASSHKSAFWPQNLSANRPSSSGVWAPRGDLAPFSLDGVPPVEEDTVLRPLWPTWPAAAAAALPSPMNPIGCSEDLEGNAGGVIDYAQEEVHFPAATKASRPAMQKLRPRSQPSKQGSRTSRTSRSLRPSHDQTEGCLVARAPCSSRGPQARRRASRVEIS